MMRLLREGVRNPTFTVSHLPTNRTAEESQAFRLLFYAGYFAQEGRITLAGMDYYRKETANPVLTWLWANWFAVIVAFMTTAATAFAGVSNFLIGNGPC